MATQVKIKMKWGDGHTMIIIMFKKGKVERVTAQLQQQTPDRLVLL